VGIENNITTLNKLGEKTEFLVGYALSSGDFARLDNLIKTLKQEISQQLFGG